MGIGAILTKIPWKPILAAAPAIEALVRKLLEWLPKWKGAKDLEEMKTALQELERALEIQADLISKLAKQSESLTLAMRTINARVTLLLCVSTAAMLLSLIVAARVFFF